MLESDQKTTNSQAHAKALASLFGDHGWSVVLEPDVTGPDCTGPDLLVSKGRQRYAVELKSSAEGRADRAIPLLSQAIFQANHHAAQSHGTEPLAVVRVGRLTKALREHASRFHAVYVPHSAVGLIDDAGGRWFKGAGLDALNAEPKPHTARRKGILPKRRHDLFSDLNQWLLKILLAPELPERLLSAPRGEYRSGAELADAAGVSAMSASRFIRRMQEEGFLDDSERTLRLVRRAELFRRWQSAAMRSSPELRMSYLIPAGGARQFHKVVSKLEGCVGLFAAADLLGLGHVSGAVPQVYVRRLVPPHGADWPGLVPSAPGESPGLILKQANAAESVFRGAVQVDDLLVADVLQVWLDASAHPSRGAEQAEFLGHGVLAGVLGDQA